MLITYNLLEEHVSRLVHNTCKSSLFDWCQPFLYFCVNFVTNFRNGSVQSCSMLHYVLVVTVLYKIPKFFFFFHNIFEHL